MKTKSIVFVNFLFAILLFCSCSDVQFTSPQPGWVTKNETSIPEHLWGYYVGHKDTLMISEKRIKDNKRNHEIDFNLSDSVVLRIYNQFYFLNFRSSEQKTWSVIMAKEEKQMLLYYMLSFQDSTVVSRLNAITPVTLSRDSSLNITNCVINPGADEFKKILEQNLFTMVDTLSRIK